MATRTLSTAVPAMPPRGVRIRGSAPGCHVTVIAEDGRRYGEVTIESPDPEDRRVSGSSLQLTDDQTISFDVPAPAPSGGVVMQSGRNTTVIGNVVNTGVMNIGGAVFAGPTNLQGAHFGVGNVYHGGDAPSSSGPATRVNVVIKVPAAAEVDLDLVASSLTTRGRLGRVKLTSAASRLSVDQVAGLRAMVTVGSYEVRQVTGEADIAHTGADGTVHGTDGAVLNVANAVGGRIEYGHNLRLNVGNVTGCQLRSVDPA